MYVWHFLISKEKNWNIAQNHSSSVQEVMSEYYFDQKWNKIKLKSVRTLLRITRLAHMKSYLVIICPNSYEKLTSS